MAGGKHASRSKSFEDLEFNRKERSRRRREQFEEDEVDDKLNVHNDILNSNAEEYDDEYDNDDDYYDDEPEINYKKIIIVVISIIVIIAIAFGIYKLVFANKEESTEDDQTSQMSEENMPTSIAGYKVLGQVIIKDLGVEQYILNLAEDNALKNGVVKLYGVALNNYGNFCMAGHNYEGIFKDLEKLNVDDKIVIKDTKNIEYEYKVTSVKTVEPDDLNCLLQDKSKVEITLITCSTGSTSRVVVKAEQIAKDNG